MLRKLLEKFTGAQARNIHAADGSWLKTKPRYRATSNEQIEARALKTEQRGALPLWEGYSKVEGYPTKTGPDAKRTSDNVRTAQNTGEFFTWLVVQRRPNAIVEFGTAFGLSGMYWLAGLEMNQHGHLFTFEPNQIWADIARENLSEIGSRYSLTTGTFENHADLIGDHTANLTFIDAIHTGEFVRAQLEIVLQKSAPGALILFDDIDFSDDMQNCWKEISEDRRFAAASEFNRVGIIELN